MKKIFSLFLALCMVVTLLPVTAMAKEIHTPICTSGEITNFAPLAETEKTVSLGTSGEELELPETLSATVRTAVSIGEDAVQDSFSPDEDASADDSVVVTTSSAIEVEVGESRETSEAPDLEWEETTVDIPVKWESTPEYDMDTEGVYVFAPVIEGYTVSVPLPEITVTVGAMVLGRGDISPMGITSYNIWVGGVQVTSENKNGITGGGITGTITYNPDTSTLTLNGARITKGSAFSPSSFTYYAGIVADCDLTIELLGDCSINTGAPVNADYYPCGMFLSNGNFTLSGDGTLDVRGANQKTSYGIYNYMSYMSSVSLTISGPTVTATGGTTSGGASYGISSQGDITISGGTVTATGGTTSSGSSYGISTWKRLSISGDAVVSATGGTSASSSYSSYGITALNADSTIASGTVTATSGNAGYYSYGIDTGAKKLSITGGTVTAKAGSASQGAAAIKGVPDTRSYTDVKILTGASESPAKVVDSYTNEKYAKFGVMGTYSVIYNGNGGSGSMTGETAAADVAFPLPLCTFTPTAGKTFDKWAVGSINGPKVAANGSHTFTADTTVYALWKTTPTAADLIYSLTAVDYDGNAKTLPVTKKTVGIGDVIVKYNGNLIAPTNAGTYAITVDIAGNAEYNAVTGLSLGNYTINKIAYPGTKAVSASVSASGQTGATVTIPTLPTGASYSTPTASRTIMMTDMSIAGTTLTYTAPARPGGPAGENGTVTIPVTGATNYNDYSIVVTVTYTAKTPQVISYATATVAKIYGDGKFTNPLTQTTVNGTITYTSGNPSVATVNPTTGEVTIVVAGSATITATAAETGTHEQAAASYTVTVAKKALTLKADDKSVTKGEALPPFTYTVTGLVNGNTVTTAPTMSITADGTTVGTFDITITDGVVTNAASYDITHTKGILTVAERLFMVTVTNGTGSGSYAESATVTITANDRSGYTFTGWSGADATFADASKKTTTFTMPAKAVTVSANYRQNSSGGDDGGSGGGSSSNDNSSPVIVTPPAPDKPNSPTQGEIKVPGTADGKGNITVNITDKIVTDAFDKALADARENGNEQNGITVVLHVDTGSKAGSNVTVNLPKAVQDTIIEKKIVNTIVVVDNPDIRIGMDLAAVQEINKQAKSDVNITATRTDSGKLTGDAKKAIGSRPVFDLKVNYGSGKSVQNFGSGSVSVTIPYILGANENAGNVQAIYVDVKGKVHWLTNSVYDSVEQVLRFSTDHFSTYGIGYKQTNTAFKDIAGHWAKEDIEFVVNRGLFSGTSTTTFSPNTAMTRGMFVTALGQLANADVSGYAKSSFADVKIDAYCMDYVEWANKNNIVNGVGNNKFAPDQSITREQMAVIMCNYAKTIGFTLPKVHAENTFEDTKISAYAKDAVKQMRMAGIISGKNGNLFDPQGTATRAEVSAVLRRFVELAISSDTMQGWTRNDSGRWMYYENGKPVTGKKDIGGTTYTFDQYGVTADVPKNLRYATYTVQKGDSFWSIARKLGCPMSELERLNNKSRFSIIYPGDVIRVPEK